MRNPYKKFQNGSIHGSKVMLCIKKRNAQTDGWTNNPEAICPANFFEVGGIKKLEMCQYKTDAPTQGHPHPPAGILQKIKLKKGP